MKKLLPVAAVLAAPILFSQSVSAESMFSQHKSNNFNEEFLFNWGVTQIDNDLGDIDVQAAALDYTYYFGDFKADKGMPYNLGVFIAPRSTVTTGFYYADAGFGSDHDWSGVSGTYVADNGFTISADYSHFDESYGGGIGYYFKEAQKVSAYFREDIASLGYQGYFRLDGERGAYLDAAYTDDEFNDSFRVDARYYLNRQFHVGAGYTSVFNGLIDDHNIFSLSAQYWLNGNAALSVGTSHSDDDVDTSTYFANLTIRIRY